MFSHLLSIYCYAQETFNKNVLMGQIV